MVESEYFLDDTGHQIPVNFSQRGYLAKIMDAAKGILGRLNQGSFPTFPFNSKIESLLDDIMEINIFAVFRIS